MYKRQVLHVLAAIQAFDIDRLKAKIRRTTANFGDQRIEMATGADQHRDFLIRRGGARLTDDLQYATAFLHRAIAAFALDDRMDDDAAVVTGWPGSGRFGITYGAGFRAVVWRKDAREGAIHPIDDARIRAVVAKQAQVAEPNVTCLLYASGCV